MRCSRCKQRPGTTRWDDGLGFGSWRCLVCVLEVQVEHARDRAAALPDLERQLTEARERAGIA